MSAISMCVQSMDMPILKRLHSVLQCLLVMLMPLSSFHAQHKLCVVIARDCVVLCFDMDMYISAELLPSCCVC